MFYFNNLPIISYNGDTIRDIFKEIVIVSELNNDWFSYYRMNEGQTLHDVSYELYDNISYWWLLAIINNIKDIHYDIVFNDEILQKLAKDLQILELTNINDWLLFPKNVNVVCSENNASGKMIDKYISNGKYLIDVRLNDVDIPFLDSCTVSIDSEKIAKISLSSTSVYNVGDVVRQDFINADSVEDFVRGHVIIKDGNDLYIYKTKINDFYQTGATFSVNEVIVTASELIPVKKKIESTLYGSIVSSENIEEFTIDNSIDYLTNYISRYDYLQEENNDRSVIKVIKREYLNALQNVIISQLG